MRTLIVFILFGITTLQAQQQIISGVLSDENNLPLPGVNVIVKGTTNGTQTNFDGQYSIATSVGDTLQFAYIGYKTVTKKINKTTNTINLQMIAETAMLEEVVVMGYGKKKIRKALGYAVSTVSAEEINNKPESDVVRSLNGKVSGVQIVGTGGAVGSGTIFIIRDGNITLLVSKRKLHHFL